MRDPLLSQLHLYLDNQHATLSAEVALLGTGVLEKLLHVNLLFYFIAI